MSDSGSTTDPFDGAPFPSELGEAAFAFRWSDLPTVTPDLPGCGGAVRTCPEDFEVTELPSYLPTGQGSHLYLDVRKRGRTTRDLVQALAAAGVPQKRIGVAGLKDKHALTRQWISIPWSLAPAADALDAEDGVEVLARTRHTNKLGMGHLRGNRFRLRLRGVEGEAEARARAVLERLGRVGVPNFFGPQRFGRFGGNAADGLRLLRGQRVPGGHRLQRFFVAALQSLLFNAMLRNRMERGLYRTVLPGDWAQKHDTGGLFKVEHDGEGERAERLEISATLPLYGKKVRPSDGVPGAVEAEVLARYQLRWSDFTGRRGARRISRIVLGEPALHGAGDGDLRLEFTLPKGSYATVVLREVMKVDVDAPLDAA